MQKWRSLSYKYFLSISDPIVLFAPQGVEQGLLELLWTVYSEGKLQSCLKLRNFQNPFDTDKSVGL